MKKLILGLLGISMAAQAHSTWRDDKAAFKSAKLDKRVYAAERELKKSIYSINEKEFKTKLEELSGVREFNLDNQSVKILDRGNAEGRKLAHGWLAQEYKKIGFKVLGHDFDGGTNFIAEKPGTNGKVLILSSHMDSVYNAGANDDGAGTVAALLIAEALKDVANKSTLRILAFDREEQGLIGSKAYAPTLEKAKVLGDIQMEMMAYNSQKDGHFHIIDCDRPESTFLTAAIMSAAQSLGLPLQRVAACTDRSDHAAFWQNDMPAVVLSENFFGGDGDRCYHQSCDVVDERLDFKYAANIATAVAHAAAKILTAD